MITIENGQYWRCPVCAFGVAIGAPASFTSPPRCGAHGEMEQTTPDGFAADINRDDDSDAPKEKERSDG